MKYSIRAACGSNAGKLRKNNEDNFVMNGVCLDGEGGGTTATVSMTCLSSEDTYFAVFDGIGGERYGEAASLAAAQKLLLCSGKKKPFYVSDARFFGELLAELNAAVLDKGKELVSERMGTTCAFIRFSSRCAHAVNAGDSRIYLWRGGSLRQLSVDDVAAHLLPGRRKAPITQFLGMDPMEVKLVPHIARTEPQDGDRYLICSDGLTDMLTVDETEALLTASATAEAAVQSLIARALDNGGRDNVTVIVCDIWQEFA